MQLQSYLAKESSGQARMGWIPVTDREQAQKRWWPVGGPAAASTNKHISAASGCGVSFLLNYSLLNGYLPYQTSVWLMDYHNHSDWFAKVEGCRSGDAGVFLDANSVRPELGRGMTRFDCGFPFLDELEADALDQWLLAVLDTFTRELKRSHRESVPVNEPRILILDKFWIRALRTKHIRLWDTFLNLLKTARVDKGEIWLVDDAPPVRELGTSPTALERWQRVRQQIGTRYLSGVHGYGFNPKSDRAHQRWLGLTEADYYLFISLNHAKDPRRAPYREWLVVQNARAGMSSYVIGIEATPAEYYRCGADRPQEWAIDKLARTLGQNYDLAIQRYAERMT